MSDLSVPARLLRVAVEASDRTAIQHAGRRRSYARVIEDVLRTARGLHDLGVRPGHRVAVIAGARAETVIAVHAALRIGAVAVLHDPASTPRELRRAFEDHSASVAIAEHAALSAVLSLPRDVAPKALIAIEPLRELGIVPPMLSVLRRGLGARSDREHPGGSDQVLPWRRVGSVPPLAPDHPYPGPDDLALLQYGPGPSGMPLAAMLSHSNLLSAVDALEAVLPQGSTAPLLPLLPLHEAAGTITGITAPLLTGRGLVLTGPTSSPGLSRVPAAVLCGTPAQIVRRERERPQRRRTGAGGTQAVLTVHGALDLEHSRRWREATGFDPLVGVLRPECGLALWAVRDDDSPSVAAWPAPGVRIDIGADGSLSVAGPQVFQGYWHHPDETASVLSGDGWVRTGDRVDADASAQHLRVRPQRRGITTAAGDVVSPREISDVLGSHPDVVSVDVRAIPQPDGGESAEASVVLRDHGAARVEDLHEFVSARLSPAKRPVSIVLRVPS